MKYFLIVIMLSIPIVLLAQEFKSLGAKAALNKYKAELKKAEDIKTVAEAQYKKDLEAALASAMKAGNLDEANLIKAELSGGEAPVVENKKDELKLILEDKHRSVSSIPGRTFNNEYDLILKRIPQKKAMLVIEHKKYGGNSRSIGNIDLNGNKIGSWDLSTNKGAEFIEIDISEHLTDTPSKFKIVFQWRGEEPFEVNSVKVKYK